MPRTRRTPTSRDGLRQARRRREATCRPRRLRGPPAALAPRAAARAVPDRRQARRGRHGRRLPRPRQPRRPRGRPQAHEGRRSPARPAAGSSASSARSRPCNIPHCLGVFDYGELGGGPFFTMELFLGQPITSLAGRRLDEVLDPLLAIDARRSTTSTVTASSTATSSRRTSSSARRPAPTARRGFETRLMDFGLAKYYGVKSSLSAEAGFVGTVAYCAPEQLNLDELDHRADLYCLGLVGYELLERPLSLPRGAAGRHAAVDAGAAQRQAEAAGRGRTPRSPAPIADAVMKYLRKQPRRRPDSAALAPHGDRRLSRASTTQTAVSGGRRSRRRGRCSRSPASSAGQRAGGRSTMSSAAACRPGSRRATRCPPSLIVVSGEPGIGKSSVVQEAERIARGHGCQVYEGRCFDGNLSPFQPFVEILRQLDRRAAAAGAPRGREPGRRGSDRHPRRRPARRVARAAAGRSSTTTAASCSASPPSCANTSPARPISRSISAARPTTSSAPCRPSSSRSPPSSRSA